MVELFRVLMLFTYFEASEFECFSDTNNLEHCIFFFCLHILHFIYYRIVDQLKVVVLEICFKTFFISATELTLTIFGHVRARAGTCGHVFKKHARAHARTSSQPCAHGKAQVFIKMCWDVLLACFCRALRASMLFSVLQRASTCFGRAQHVLSTPVLFSTHLASSY